MLAEILEMEVREQVTNDTTNAVDSKDIEGIVNTDEVLEFGGIITGECTDNAKDDSGPGRNVAAGRSDGNETSDGTRAPTNGTPLAIETVVNNHPCKPTHRSRKIGNNAGHSRSEIATECTTTVESKPSEPEEDCSENDMSNVVRTIIQFVGSVTTSFTEHDGISEGCCAR